MNNKIFMSLENMETTSERSINTSSKVRLSLTTFVAAVIVTCTLILMPKFYPKSNLDSTIVAPSRAATPGATQTCAKQTVRREWRTISSDEKQSYIDAVKCLMKVPSAATTHTKSLHDDFSHVHNHQGSASHGSAMFLPWHRYFIQAYEDALHHQCHYTAGLVYWDWTMDWENLTQAPVWDKSLGFGGDGNNDTPLTVGFGRCVTEGPFANTTVGTYGDEDNAHCLSRGFRRGDDFAQLCTQQISPDAIQDLLQLSDYNSFNLGLEHSAHHMLPNCIRGDWLEFTVPYGR